MPQVAHCANLQRPVSAADRLPAADRLDMALRSKVFIVQKGAANLDGYPEKINEIVGVFASLKDANVAVKQCQQEFMKEFGIAEEEDKNEFIGFKVEDRGDEYDDTPPPGGVLVGYYWEFDEDLEGYFYSCSVYCFPLIPQAA